MPELILARQRQIVGTSGEWAADDLVLGAGELAIERQADGSVRAKVGNGSLPFSEAPYLASGTTGLIYRGEIDPTGPPPAGAEPGDLYSARPAGVVAPAWGEPAAGESLAIGDLLALDAGGTWNVIPGTIDPAGFVLESELGAPTGAGLAGFSHAITYPPGTIGAHGRSRVSVKDAPFNALGDGVANDTAAVQAAINSGAGREIVFPPGFYQVDNLTCPLDNVRLVAIGGTVVLRKRANGPLITLSGDLQEMRGIAVYGEAASFTGHNIVSTGNNFRLINCGSRNAAGRAVKCSGSHVQIWGTCDIFQTADVTATGYEIEISAGVPGTPTLYHHIFGVYTSSPYGGVLLTETGAASISGCQFGKLTVKPGGGGSGAAGPYVSNCRINGATVIEVSNAMLSSLTASAPITIGDGANAISGICVADTVVLQAGQAFTVNDKVTASVLHVGQILDNGASVTIHAGSQFNHIYHGPRTYSPTLTAYGGAPTVGNGSLTGFYARSGRRVTVGFLFDIGSTTNLGTDEMRISIPAISSNIAIAYGSGEILDSGVGFKPIAPFVDAAKTYMSFAVDTITGAPAGNHLTQGVPIVFAAGDRIKATVDYWVGAAAGGAELLEAEAPEAEPLAARRSKKK